MTSDLSCSLHIQQICVCCFMSGNVKLLLREFIVYVIPMLEYNSVTWSTLDLRVAAVKKRDPT